MNSIFTNKQGFRIIDMQPVEPTPDPKIVRQHNCVFCGRPAFVTDEHVQEYGGAYCSDACLNAHRAQIAAFEKTWVTFLAECPPYYSHPSNDAILAETLAKALQGRSILGATVDELLNAYLNCKSHLPLGRLTIADLQKMSAEQYAARVQIDEGCGGAIEALNKSAAPVAQFLHWSSNGDTNSFANKAIPNGRSSLAERGR